MSDMRIAYNELANYNNGDLVYKWFDLDGVSKEEHYQELSDWLGSLAPVHGCPCEEWCVGDVEGVPRDLVGDFGIDDKFFEMMEAVDASCLDLEVFQAGIDCGLEVSEVEDRYAGSHDTDEEFAQEFAASTGALTNLSETSWPNACIDWEWAARELMYDYVDSGTHYFHNC